MLKRFKLVYCLHGPKFGIRCCLLHKFAQLLHPLVCQHPVSSTIFFGRARVPFVTYELVSFCFCLDERARFGSATASRKNALPFAFVHVFDFLLRSFPTSFFPHRPSHLPLPNF